MAVTASFPEYWSRGLQRYLYKHAVYPAIVSWEAHKALKDGDTFNKPYGSDLAVSDYTRGQAFSVQTISTTNEYLTVDKQKVVPFYIDKFDELQDHYSMRNYFIKRAGERLANTIDGDVLAEVANATYDLDYKDIDSTKTANYACPLTTTNIPLIFTVANRKLNEANVPMSERCAVVDPRFFEILTQYLAGRATELGDRTNENGYMGKFMGIELYMSNALYWTGKLGMATNPTNGDTISINGVTFTWKTTLGTAAGNINICSDAAHSVANLVASINAPGTSVAEDTDAGFVALSAADQAKLKNITATNGTTYITLVAKGWGYIPVAETFTDTTDEWDDNLCMVHYLFGRKGAINLAIQAQPTTEVKDVPDKLGKNIVSYTMYGIKTFTEGANEIIDVKINTKDWV